MLEARQIRQARLGLIRTNDSPPLWDRLRLFLNDIREMFEEIWNSID